MSSSKMSRMDDPRINSPELICDHCNQPVNIRNASGICDHLYYPENCEVCRDRGARRVLRTEYDLSRITHSQQIVSGS